MHRSLLRHVRFATARQDRLMMDAKTPKSLACRAGSGRVSKTENGRKVKRLWLGWIAHKFRGVGSGAPRKNHRLEIRRLARSIRDVAFAGRRESVAEARSRCGSGGRPPLIWTQPSTRQAQPVGQTTWRICSLEIAAEESREAE